MGALICLVLAASGLTIERSVRARQPLEVLPLDVAFLDADRLFVLSDETMSLYRIEGARLLSVSRLALPGAPVRARAPAGMLRVVARDGACWAVSNRRGGATLFDLEGDRLVVVAGAEAIPPTAFGGNEAAPDGVRFVAGSNLLAVGETRRLRFAGDGDGVGPDGTLLLGGEPDASGRRAGDALAVLDDRFVVVSGLAPPGDWDEIRLLRRGEADAVAAWPTRGRIRALAARSAGGSTAIAVAVETTQGGVLELQELRWSAW